MHELNVPFGVITGSRTRVNRSTMSWTGRNEEHHWRDHGDSVVFQIDSYTRNGINTMKKLKLILTMLWVLLFIYLGYTSYNKYGDDAMLSAFLHIGITFPLCIPFLYILNILDPWHPSVTPYGFMHNLLFEGGFFVIGYLQWFILLPWIIKKLRRWKGRC